MEKARHYIQQNHSSEYNRQCADFTAFLQPAYGETMYLSALFHKDINWIAFFLNGQAKSANLEVIDQTSVCLNKKQAIALRDFLNRYLKED